MNHYYNLSGALIRTLALAGFSHIRDSLEWGHVESGTPGNYTVEPQYDAMIADAKANGIRPLLVTGYRNALYDGGKTPSTPAGLAGFGRYQSFWLKHFAGTTNDIETYNEYYQPGFNDSACGVTGACFVQLMKAAYEQTHADNPSANVIADIGPNKGDTSFRDQVLSNGGLAYLDSINAHIYTFAGPEGDLDTQLQSLRTAADANGGSGKPIWVSEEGYPTAPSFGGSMIDQARKSIRTDTIMVASNVSQFYWYDALNDGTNLDDKESTFGLLQAPAGSDRRDGAEARPGREGNHDPGPDRSRLQRPRHPAVAAVLVPLRFRYGDHPRAVVHSRRHVVGETQHDQPARSDRHVRPQDDPDPDGRRCEPDRRPGPGLRQGTGHAVTQQTAPQLKIAAADPSNSQEPTAVTVTLKGAVSNLGPTRRNGRGARPSAFW